MRLADIFESTRNYKNQKVLQYIDRKLINGGQIEIIDASYAPHQTMLNGPYSWYELEQLGYATKERQPGHGTMTSERWLYHGPQGSSIKIKHSIAKIENGQTTHEDREIVLKPGEGTEWIDVDYD